MINTNSSLIKATDIAQLLDDKEVVFLDARGGNDALERYYKGHLVNAHFIDLENELSTKSVDHKDGGRHPLPSTYKFGDVLNRYGISGSTRVIIYDDKNGGNAASRLWWMLKAFGHKKVQVIDGGMASIVKAGLPVSTGQTKPIQSNESYKVPSSWQSPVVTIEEVEKAISDPEYLIIDVRENYRYRGESEPIDQVAGHIPSAINVPYLNNLDPDGQFKSVEELKALYDKELQGKDHKKIIVHCGSGVTACHTLLALEEAGISGANLYVGSWSEWSRSGRPVIVG